MTTARFGEFRLDSLNECLWRRHPSGQDERIQLPPKAYAVLSLLVANAGRLVTQDQLLDVVWPGTHIQPEGLKNQILHLRRVLGDDPRRARFIETLPRRGYRFIWTDAQGGTATPAESQSGCRLVAREPDLALLDRALAFALDARRQVIFVTGEAGIGKSALVEAFGERAPGAAPELAVARGQCVEGLGKEPYYPILDALDAYWREHPGEGAPRAVLATPGTPMLRDVRDALEAIAARCPLLLVLEDLQWVDQATVDVLAVLARGRASCRLLVIGTCRSEPARALNGPLKMLRQELLVHGLAREIALEPLPVEGVAEFIGARRGSGEGGMELARLLHRHCGGNPLFMGAALEDLHRRGLVVRRGNGWRMNASAGEFIVPIPERVRHMIEAHIEDMPDDERQVLEAASVVGASFHGSVAAAAAQLSPAFIEDTCERLSADGRILRGGPRAYEFVHGFYRDVLYQRQPAWQRAAFERRVEEHEKDAPKV